MTTDREPGETTMIRISIEVRELLEKEKIIPREPLNDLLKRIIIDRHPIVVPPKEDKNQE